MGEKKSMCRKRKEEEEDEEEAKGGGEQHHLIFLASGHPGADFDKKTKNLRPNCVRTRRENVPVGFPTFL